MSIAGCNACLVWVCNQHVSRDVLWVFWLVSVTPLVGLIAGRMKVGGVDLRGFLTA